VVAFCNLNHFDYIYSKNEIDNITNDGVIDQYNPNFTANDYAVNIGRYLRYNFIKNFLKNLNQLYNKDFTIDQILLSCTFQSKNCSMEDFMSHYDFMYGLCYRFNMGKTLQGKDLPIKTSGEVGWMHGLQLELYAGNSEIQDKYAIKRGFRLLVFNKSTVYPIAADIGVDVSTGHETNIGIRRTFTNHLPAPYSDCMPIDISKIDWNQNEVLSFMYEHFVQGQYYWSGDFWPAGGNWTWNWTVVYSQVKCVKMCYQKYLFQSCGKYFCKTNFQL
jgi:hypothetical protein